MSIIPSDTQRPAIQCNVAASACNRHAVHGVRKIQCNKGNRKNNIS